MTRDDREVMHEGRCLCGAGSVRITHVTPGGPYGKARWEKLLECKRCGSQYDLDHDRALRLSKRFEVWFVRKGDPRGTRISAPLE
jgi:hypothetical protein